LIDLLNDPPPVEGDIGNRDKIEKMTRTLPGFPTPPAILLILLVFHLNSIWRVYDSKSRSSKSCPFPTFIYILLLSSWGVKSTDSRTSPWRVFKNGVPFIERTSGQRKKIQWSPTGKPVVPKNHTHLCQGFGGSSAGERNPPKQHRLIVEMVYRTLTHSSTAEAVPARRSVYLAFLHAGVVSCVGG